jgi:uncharacterized membrane protein YphA (DoxX/SURF4 family)
MNEENSRNRHIALWGLRWIIGFLSAQIGMQKIFIEGLEAQMRWFKALEEWFPLWVLQVTNVYAAGVELVAGTMLVLGFKRDWALWAILSVLVIVTFGHGLEAAVWDLHQTVFRLSMVITLLLLPAEWDRYRIDYWSGSRATKGSA